MESKLRQSLTGLPRGWARRNDLGSLANLKLEPSDPPCSLDAETPAKLAPNEQLAKAAALEGGP